MSVSVLILTRNEEACLPGCLDSLGWCDDIYVRTAEGWRINERHFTIVWTEGTWIGATPTALGDQ